MNPTHVLVLIAALSSAAVASAAPASFEPVRKAHVLAGPTRTTLDLLGGRVVSRAARSRATGEAVPAPRAPLASPDRVVWLVGARIRTRAAFVEGVEVERRSFELASGRELRPDYHLYLPDEVAATSPASEAPPLYVDAAPRRSAPPPAPRRVTRIESEPTGEDDLFGFEAEGADFPDSDGAYVGAAQSAKAVFGEDLGGLLEAENERPKPLEIHGYAETLLMFGEDGPSSHVLETGLSGNRALETKEVVFNLEAALGRDVTFFGQIRAVRFNRFDHRIAMLRIGDPKDEHWTVGRQVNPFGSFPARNLSTQNPLYGYPIPYFYRTSLKNNVAPTSRAALLAGRGQGPGVGQAGPGLYQTYILRNAHLGRKGRLTYGLQNGAQGTTENVTTNDDVGFIVRASVSPTPAWTLGASGSVAGYLSQNVGALGPGESPEDFDQQLLGFDLEFSRGKWRIFAEGLWSDWDVSSLMGVGGQLGSMGWYLEGTYQASAKLFFAGRYSTIEFDDIPDGAGGQTPWDFDADRLEVGVGYRPTINVLAKLSGQMNDTDTTPDPDDDVLVLQLIGSF